MPGRKEYAALAAVALGVAALFAAAVPEPAYTDAYYYFNAGRRLAQGEGLTDPYIALTYIGAPEALPAPAHTYWMPLTSLLVALAGGSFRLGQVIFVLMWVALAVLAFWLGGRLGGSRRHAWAAGLLTVCPGYYAPFLTTTDTFAPFGLLGALSLLAMGLGRWRGGWRHYALAGALAGLAHLARADGLLLVGVLALMAVWPRPESGSETRPHNFKRGLAWTGAGLAAYGLVMLPWLVRNWRAIGTPLPVGGAATIWLRGYDEIVRYPAAITADSFFAWGWENIVRSRWEALVNNLGTFVAVEGLIVLSPLIVIALIRRWRHPLLLPVAVYAVLLHLAMTVAFAYPGYRGGLFHSAAALIPWWMAAGVLGLDDVVDWVARRRRHWRAATAKMIFTAAAIVIAALLTVAVSRTRLGRSGASDPLIRAAREVLPEDAVVMSNDPAAVYYHTGLSGVVVPDSGPEAIRALAGRYGVTHVLLDENRTLPLNDLYEGREQPPFLRPIPQDVADSVRVFEVLP